MTPAPRRLGGIAPALVTPFDERLELDCERARPLLDFLLGAGVDGLYVGGSTGEGFLQSLEERAEYLRWVAGVVKGRVTLIAHVGAISTREAVRLAEIAADAGYDAVAATPPFYYGFTNSRRTTSSGSWASRGSRA
jgi:N-acetylneuraminate lyase